LKGCWVEPDVRDAVVDFVNHWSEKADLEQRLLLKLIGLGRSKFANWRQRYGKVNEHNAWMPRDSWLTEAEVEAILAFRAENPLEGYRVLVQAELDFGQVVPQYLIARRMPAWTKPNRRPPSPPVATSPRKRRSA
jgi:hypothetical protein